jgi:hypothetical protein
MNSFFRTRATFFICILVSASAASTGAVSTSVLSAQKIDPLNQDTLADLLPSTTQLIVSASSIQAAYDAVEQSDIGKQFSGEVWKRIATVQAKTNKGSLLHPSPWIGMNWQDLGPLNAQGVVVAFAPEGSEIALAFFAKLGPDSSKHPFVLRWFEVHGGKANFQVTPTTDGTQLYTQVKKGQLPICLAIGPKWICTSASAPAVKQWLNTEASKAIQLEPAKGDAWNKLPAISKTPGSMAFWVSPWNLFKSYAAKDNVKLLRSMDLFGMPGLGNVTGTITPIAAAGPSKTSPQWSLKYEMNIAQPTVNGLALLNYKKGPLPILPALFGSSMDHISASYIDVKPWFQGVNYAVDQLIDEDTPGNFGDLLDSLLTDPEGPKIDVRKEFIYRMGPLMILSSDTVPDLETPGQFKREKVWASSLQDVESTSKSLSALFKNDEEVHYEKIGPFRCWNAENDESLFVSLSKGENQAICVAAIDDKFIYLATNTAWLKGLISKSITVKEGADASTLWRDHVSTMESKEFSSRQASNMSTWLQRSWGRIPEQMSQQYRTVDWPAMLMTTVLVPGLESKDLPNWSQVQKDFGVIVHEFRQTAGNLQGELILKSSK